MTSLQDMDALSLFDGMGCGWIALRELGITPRRCYASEIDRHAIAQVKLNFPEVENLGDVTKWHEWDIDWSRIGLLLAGSPCQDVSFAGKMRGLDKDSDTRSSLFFVFVDILNHIRKFNPDVKFLLENVNMKREHMRVINEYVGLFPVNINSSLVSAQNRDRWYWSNVRTRRDGLFGEVHTDIPQPADRGILLRDILEKNVPEKYYLSDKSVSALMAHAQRNKEAGDGFAKKPALPDSKMNALKCGGAGSDDLVCISSNQSHATKSINKSTPLVSAMGMGGGHVPMVIQLNPSTESGGIQPYQQNRVYDTAGKSPALMAEMSCGSHAIICQNLAPRSGKTGKGGTGYLSRNDGKAYCIQASSQANGIEIKRNRLAENLKQTNEKANALLSTSHKGAYANGMSLVGVIQLNPAQEFGTQPRQQNMFYSTEGKSPSLNTCMGGNLETKIWMKNRIRRLIPTECARLQTIPEWYKWGCSEKQQYKMLGNGWTVEVITHILQYL